MELTINLTKKQTKAWDYLNDGVTTELGYGGGARGGKSWLGAEFINFMCLAYPESRWLVGRKQLKNLKRTTLVTIFKVFRHHKLVEGVEYRYNDQMSIITYKNGSEILLYDLAYQPSDPLFTSLGGLEITGAWIDESNEVSFEAVDIINSRCGNWNNDRYGIKPILLETFNPSKNHIYRRYYKPFRDGTLPKHRMFVPALVTDNPHVPKAYIQKLEQGSKITKERLLYGNFDYDDDPMKIFAYDSILNCFSNTFVKPGERYITGDVGGRGKDKTVLYVWDGWKIIHIFYESITHQGDLLKRVEELRKRFNVPLSHVLLDYNGIGTGVVDILGCVPFNAGMAPIEGEEDIWHEYDKEKRPMFKNLRSQLWIYLAEEIVNKNMMHISLDSVEFKGDPVDLKDIIVEELDVMKELVEGGETKRQVISKGSAGDSGSKQTIRQMLGRSPDFGDGIMMRGYFDLVESSGDLGNIGELVSKLGI